jgi:hypothetical protein
VPAVVTVKRLPETEQPVAVPFTAENVIAPELAVGDAAVNVSAEL